MTTTLVWFRSDLRLADNPALHDAVRRGDKVIPVFIWAPEEAGAWVPGGASRWWLHHSLFALDATLRGHGSRLILRRGPSRVALEELITETGATRVVWNRCYQPLALERDREIGTALQDQGIEWASFNANLLVEPWQVRTRTGAPYRVFTPFWRACRELGWEERPLPTVGECAPVSPNIDSLDLGAFGLLPKVAWDSGLRVNWQVGEQAALERLQEFCDDAFVDYAGARDYPSRPGTSRLSPHLHFGEISPRQIAWALMHAAHTSRVAGAVAAAEAYVRELGWREFAHHVLFHYPHTTDAPMDPRFADFPWRADAEEMLCAWQRGRTGYPIVDAGMRELWQTGWMHNRVRMITASFLTKNARLSWHRGASWFWDTLVDADLANNSLGWQWVAGCGADAAPYFRIFNPILQSKKFDAAGAYIRRWLPELDALPDRWIHAPWEAPTTVQAEAKVVVGRDYPAPVLDLKATRDESLAVYRTHLQAVANA